MKNFCKYCFLITLLFIYSPTTATASIEGKQNVLVLNPSSDTTYSNSLFESIRTTLDENNDKYTHFISGLKGILTEDKLSDLKKTLHNNKIDLIICLDGSSAKMIQDNFDFLDVDIPVLYTTLYTPLPPHPNFGAFYMDYDLEAYINELLKLHPQTKKINFLIDIPLKKSIFYEKIESFIVKYSPNFDFNIIETGNINDIGYKFQGNNTLTIIYSTVKTPIKGTPGYRHSSIFGSTKHIASITTEPVYGGVKDFATEFNSGAFNFCGYNLGQKLISTAFALLDKNIKISNVGSNLYKEDTTLLINDHLSTSFCIPNNLENVSYYDYRDTNTILAIKNQNLYFALFIFLISAFFIVIIMALYSKKVYKAKLSSELVKTNLIANISHELRTPLNIILSTLQLVPIFIKNKQIVINDPVVLEKYSYLKKNSLRLLRLVNNVIDFTKFDAGFSEANKEIYNIVSIVEDVTLSSVDYAEKNQITLLFDTSSEEIISKFDKDQIERITLNFLSNALKFTPEGGQVLVYISENDTDVFVSVSDTGIGISPSDLNIIFERFRQAEDNLLRKNEGSGIGLSLCKSMIELNGGAITVESTPNEGSTFTFSLKKSDGLPITNLNTQNVSEKINIEYSDFIIND